MAQDTLALETPQPHFLPGYTGYCPQYLFRVGETFGSQTHKILLDPSVNHAERLVLSDRAPTDLFMYSREKNDTSPPLRPNPKYQNPVMPGYQGFIPQINAQVGQTFSIAAEDAMSQFELDQLRLKQTKNVLFKEIEVQDNKWEPGVADRQMIKSNYRLPLIEVRPERAGILKTISVAEPGQIPRASGESPYFMDVLDPEKRFKTGYAGHVPYGYSKFGEGFGPYTNSALCDFTSNYRKRLSTEWAPVSIIKSDPPLMIQSSEIYHKQAGMVPNYTGHVPGVKLRCGKTFGSDSRDAKRFLRGDYS